MRFLESAITLTLIITAVALVSVYFARGRDLPFELFVREERTDDALKGVAVSFDDPPTPSIWAEKVRELETQESFFGFFAVPTGMGTAFYIDEAGTLLTAAHVVSGPGPYLLERFGGHNLFRVSVLDVDFGQDLALLGPEVPLATVMAREGGALPTFDLSVDSPTVGETVWALCAAPAEQARVIEMRVTRIHAAAIVGSGEHKARLNDAIILDDQGSSHGGCSGGPIVNERGAVVGMLNGGGDGIAIASSADSIRAWTERTRAAADRATPSAEGATSTAGTGNSRALARLCYCSAWSQGTGRTNMATGSVHGGAGSASALSANSVRSSNGGRRSYWAQLLARRPSCNPPCAPLGLLRVGVPPSPGHLQTWRVYALAQHVMLLASGSDVSR